MTKKRLLLGIGSVTLTFFLLLLLVKISKVDLHGIIRQLIGVSWISFARLAGLTGVLVYLSTEKWLSIDAAWRNKSECAPSVVTSFACTSAGLALGIFLPVQLAMSTARTLGTRIHGKSLKSAVGGTLYEQGFDFITVCFLGIASGITSFYRGGGMMWTISALAATTLALLAVEPSVRLMRWRGTSQTEKALPPRNPIAAALQRLLQMRHSNLVDATLARRLVLLSALRFGVVVLISLQTADSIHVHIPAWQMAAAIPFVVVASIIGITPGGLGVNELTSVTALKIFGTPLAIGTQWALANRVLVAVSYIVVAGSAAVVLGAQRMLAHSENTTERATESR